MKKTFFLSLLAVMLFAGAGCIGGDAEPQVGDAYDGEFKLVTVTADVTVYPDDTQAASTCTGSGAIAADFYFLPGGGDLIDYNATLTLTDYRCYPYGDSPQCVGTVLGDGYEPIDLTMSATLSVDGEQSYDSAGELIENADVLAFHVSEIPYKSFEVLMECGGEPGMVTDPGPFPQIALPFMQEVWTLGVPVGSVETLSRDNIQINFNQADVLITTTSTLDSFVQ